MCTINPKTTKKLKWRITANKQTKWNGIESIQLVQKAADKEEKGNEKRR